MEHLWTYVNAPFGCKRFSVKGKSTRLIAIDFYGKDRIEAVRLDGAAERGVVRRRVGCRQIFSLMLTVVRSWFDRRLLCFPPIGRGLE